MKDEGGIEVGFLLPPSSVFLYEGLLAGDGAVERGGGRLEGDQEGISGLLHFLPSMFPETVSEQTVVCLQGLGKGRSRLFPQPGRTLDVGEEEGHRAAGQIPWRGGAT